MAQSTHIRDSALTLLSQNVTPSSVAATLGVTESYVSQLMAQEDFASELSLKKQELAAEDQEHDNALDRTEARYLQILEQKAPFANIAQATIAFRALNAARRRKDTRGPQAQEHGGTVVNLTIPVAIVPQYVLNSQSEIVEVEGRTMAGATAESLNRILAARGVQVERPSGVLKAERAADTLEIITPKPARKAPKLIPTDLL